MSYIVISDGLDYKIARSIESFKNHVLVELATEKTQKKVKLSQIIYTLEEDITKINGEINQLLPQIDTQLLAELIDNTEHKTPLQELSALYFGDNPTSVQNTALLFALTKDNTTFYNCQDGTFRKYTPEEKELQTRILAKQIQAQAQFAHYSTLFNQAYNNNELLHKLDDVDPFRLLHKPDKHSPAYKALHHTANQLKLTPLELCHNVGLIPDLPAFFLQCFMFDNRFDDQISSLSADTAINIDHIEERLDLQVFSIDDAATTEIDDAFSVNATDSGYTVGIHIAAPALNLDIADMVANNISTVYFPGNKITMLPQSIIDQYSLWEGKTCPVVSIYFMLDTELNIIDYTSSLNIVKIQANLRIEKLEALFNEQNLTVDHGYPYEKELKLLYKFALKLEEKRGKPSVNTLFVDYNFNFDNDKIQIKPRIRGNPIDKLVSELMILANCSWGRLLTNNFIPAIYRVKQPNYPVKMTLNPESHTGLNVDYYTWATSPLRRAADYINQRQIISLVHEKNGGYTATNSTLLEVVENFDTKYAKYIDFQNKMERYWALKFLIQEQITTINATIAYKLTAQLDGVPLEVDLSNFITPKPKGTVVNLKIYNITLVLLTFDFKVIENNI